jgi:hypothetical protein
LCTVAALLERVVEDVPDAVVPDATLRATVADDANALVIGIITVLVALLVDNTAIGAVVEAFILVALALPPLAVVVVSGLELCFSIHPQVPERCKRMDC